MRRADRLFELVRLLRRKKAVTGQTLADELGVSLRTLYRDVADLIASGVPIEGEAGVGYRLGAGFELPPLMFREPELEAILLGARMVSGFGDPELERAAKSAIDRITRVLPRPLLARLDAVHLYAPGFGMPDSMRVHLPNLRRAIVELRYVEIVYAREDGAISSRRLRPLGLAFHGRSWILVGHCELRSDYRSFRLDRIRELVMTSERFEHETGKTLAEFFAREGIEPSLYPPTGSLDGG